MKKIVCLAYLCLLQCCVLAQKPYTIRLRTNPEDLIQAPKRLFYIHQVVDARTITKPIFQNNFQKKSNFSAWF